MRLHNNNFMSRPYSLLISEASKNRILGITVYVCQVERFNYGRDAKQIINFDCIYCNIRPYVQFIGTDNQWKLKKK